MPADSKPAIYERMVAILKALPAIGKDTQNQALNFKFRSVDAIINELNPALEKHGVFILPEIRSTHVEPKTKGYAATVEVAYHFVADDGSEVVAVVAGEGHDFADKAVSKAMTMAFKTCLGQVFAISTEDDPDGDSVATTPPAPGGQRAENPGVAEPVTPAPAPPPGSLDQRRQDNFTWAKGLPPKGLADLKEKMAGAGMGMDFSAHTEEQTALIESWREPF